MRPIRPDEIVEEGNRLIADVMKAVADNMDRLEWFVRNGWLKVSIDIGKTERFIEAERTFRPGNIQDGENRRKTT